MEKIKSILLEFVEYFSTKYPGKKPRCQKCGLPKQLDIYCIDNVSWFICEDCYQLHEDKINEANLENEYVPTNYLSGFMGSLLFSIPGILVTILVFVFLNMLGAFSSLLYVYLGIMGYKKFKGKISRFGSILIILSTIIMVGFGVIISYSVFILKELKTVDIETLINVLKIPEIQSELVKNIILSYLVSGFYLVFQIIQMMKEWKPGRTVKRASEI